VNFGEDGVGGAVCLPLESDSSCIVILTGDRAIAAGDLTMLLEILDNLTDRLQR
jgi:hypothetical protein